MLPRLPHALVALMVFAPLAAAEGPGRAGGQVPSPPIPTPARPWVPSPTPVPPWARTPTPVPPWVPTPTPARPSDPAATPSPAASPLPANTPAPRPTATPIPTGAVRVKVLVAGADGRTLPAPDAVAWFPGLGGPGPAAPPRMASREKRFEPRVLAVPKGTTVTFPNYDRIFHNVFSLSETGPFDLGLYRNGASRATSFEKPGVVRVYCNIHPQMAAYVLVLDGSLYAQAGKDGVAVIPGVPAGRREMKVWDERGGEWSGPVVVPPGGTVEVAVALDASTWKEQPHRNKHGKAYPPPDDDENRY